jgi:hypothetical protein
MTSSNSHSSYFEAAFGKPVNLVWFIRGFSAAALVAIALAMFVFKNGGRHYFCLGLAAGILIGLLVQSSGIKSVELKENQQRSDVNHYPLA